MKEMNIYEQLEEILAIDLTETVTFMNENVKLMNERNDFTDFTFAIEAERRLNETVAKLANIQMTREERRKYRPYKLTSVLQSYIDVAREMQFFRISNATNITHRVQKQAEDYKRMLLKVGRV